MNQVQVSGKVIFLSGGAGGLGRSLADLLLTRGGSVWVGDVSEAGVDQVVQTLREKHSQARLGGAVLDVRSGESWQAAWQECVESLGQPDILVNIAGVKGEEDWQKVYDVNLKGVHHGVQTALRQMSREAGGRGGVVVNVSSTCGVTCHGDMFATPAYTASKHAVTALTRTFGVRLVVTREQLRSRRSVT